MNSSDDRLSIERTMTIYDPYYTEPLVRQRFSARGDDLELTEQAPCDPDSYYRDLDDERAARGALRPLSFRSQGETYEASADQRVRGGAGQHRRVASR